MIRRAASAFASTTKTAASSQSSQSASSSSSASSILKEKAVRHFASSVPPPTPPLSPTPQQEHEQKRDDHARLQQQQQQQQQEAQQQQQQQAQQWTTRLHSKLTDRQWLLSQTITMLVFGITGTTTMTIVRPLLHHVIGVDGTFWSGPWSYRLAYLCTTLPLYSMTLITVGTVFGRRLFFMRVAFRMYARVMPATVRTRVQQWLDRQGVDAAVGKSMSQAKSQIKSQSGTRGKDSST